MWHGVSFSKTLPPTAVVMTREEFVNIPSYPSMHTFKLSIPPCHTHTHKNTLTHTLLAFLHTTMHTPPSCYTLLLTFTHHLPAKHSIQQNSHTSRHGNTFLEVAACGERRTTSSLPTLPHSEIFLGKLATGEWVGLCLLLALPACSRRWSGVGGTACGGGNFALPCLPLPSLPPSLPTP